MPTPENGTSRQRVIRVPIPVDDWLLELAREDRASNPDARTGVATKANAILLKAYKADPRNKKKWPSKSKT